MFLAAFLGGILGVILGLLLAGAATYLFPAAPIPAGMPQFGNNLIFSSLFAGLGLLLGILGVYLGIFWVKKFLFGQGKTQEDSRQSR